MGLDRSILAALCLAIAAPVLAEPRVAEIGGDHFRSGSGSGERLAAPRDVFVAGASVSLRGEAAGAAHAMGFDVDVEIDATDAYAMGASVEIDAELSGDVTAMGASVEIDDDARIGGNARVMGASVVVDGTVDGALIATGGEIVLDGPIAGDARLTGASISFGDEARVGGVLTYSAPDPIDVPAAVAPPDRVVFEPLTGEGAWRAADEIMGDAGDFAAPGALALVGGFLTTLAFVTLVAALALSFAPKTVEARRAQALARPGLTLLLGAAGLSLLIGLAPVSVMTVVGLLFLPLIVLCALILWVAGYVLGAYVVGLRLWTGLGGDEPSKAGRLALVAGTTTLVALLNFIPVIGWLCNFALTLFGIGALTIWALTAIFGAGYGEPARAVPSDES